MSRALLWIYKALWWIYRALLWRYGYWKSYCHIQSESIQTVWLAPQYDFNVTLIASLTGSTDWLRLSDWLRSITVMWHMNSYCGASQTVSINSHCMWQYHFQYLYLRKRALYIHQRALYIRKTALDISHYFQYSSLHIISICISAKEPCIPTKEPYISTKQPYTLHIILHQFSCMKLAECQSHK